MKNLVAESLADACVTHHEVHGRSIVLKQLRLDLENDFTLLGKFDSVADQVEDDLSQSTGVAGNKRRNLGRDFAKQFEPLLIRTQGHRFERIFDRSEEHTSELQSLRHLVCPL